MWISHLRGKHGYCTRFVQFGYKKKVVFLVAFTFSVFLAVVERCGGILNVYFTDEFSARFDYPPRFLFITDLRWVPGHALCEKKTNGTNCY